MIEEEETPLGPEEIAILAGRHVGPSHGWVGGCLRIYRHDELDWPFLKSVGAWDGRAETMTAVWLHHEWLRRSHGLEPSTTSLH